MKTLDDILENTVLAPCGCMLWLGATSGDPSPGKTGRGYPRMSWRGRNVGVHRLVVKLSGRVLSPTHTVDHACPTFPINRLCVRPEHLEAMTHKRNCALRDKRRRRAERNSRASDKRAIVTSGHPAANVGPADPSRQPPR